MDLVLRRRRDRLDAATKLLTALSYQGVLARGFALVRDAEGRPLRSAAAIGPGTALAIEFADGRIAATAEGEAPPASPKPSPRPAEPKPRKAGEGKTEGQGTLF